VVREKHEGGKIGQFEAGVEDEVGLQPAVGDEGPPAELWKRCASSVGSRA
jgi:hypothetical protein